MSRRPSGKALLLGGVVVFVVVVVVAALAVLDSPAEQRHQRLDERRVEDLLSIAAAIDAYWTREGALPPALETLAGWEGIDAPRGDPETGAAYRYRITGARSYELCATFATGARDREPRYARPPRTTFWRHPAGDHCFQLEAAEVKR